MAETDNRQQDMQETARRLAEQQARAQAMVRQRQEAARKAQLETEKLQGNVQGQTRQTAMPQTPQLDAESFSDLVFVESKPSTAKRQAEPVVPNRPRADRGMPLEEKPDKRTMRLNHWGKVGQWFQTFCWMHIPIFGFWYMVVTALRRKNPEEKRAFAKAYILYRLLVLLLALTILYVFYRMGLSFLEQILAYVKLHSL